MGEMEEKRGWIGRRDEQMKRIRVGVGGGMVGVWAKWGKSGVDWERR